MATMSLSPDPNRPLGEAPPKDTPWQLSSAAFRRLVESTSEPGLTPTPAVKLQRVQVSGQTLDAANAASFGTGRITGPVAALKSLASRWRLDDSQVKTLLSLSAHQSAGDLFRGTISLVGDDQRHRAGYLITIDGLLSGILRGPDITYAWLTESKRALDGDSPLERMLKGSMEDMLTVKQLVEAMAGQ